MGYYYSDDDDDGLIDSCFMMVITIVFWAALGAAAIGSVVYGGAWLIDALFGTDLAGSFLTWVDLIKAG